MRGLDLDRKRQAHVNQLQIGRAAAAPDRLADRMTGWHPTFAELGVIGVLQTIMTRQQARCELPRTERARPIVPTACISHNTTARVRAEWDA